MGVGKRGIERQRLFVTGGGVIGLLPRHVDIPQIIDKIRRLRPQLHRFSDKIHRGFGIAVLLAKNAQPVQGIGMAGIALQNTAVKSFRLAQAARLMVGGSLRHEG